MTLEQANAKLTLAYRAYFKARPEFPKWREEFQIGLIEAVAEDTGRTAKQIKAIMEREKHQRVMGNNAKYIRKKTHMILFFGQRPPMIMGKLLNVKMKKKLYHIWQS